MRCTRQTLTRLALQGSVILMLAACTKSAPSASTVKIQIPDFNKANAAKAVAQNVTAFSTLTFPSRVMINVRGDGIDSPIVRIISSNDYRNPGSQTISLSIPQGANRLIQALVITTTVQLDSGGNVLDGEILESCGWLNQET